MSLAVHGSAQSLGRKSLVCVVDASDNHRTQMASALLSFYEVAAYSDYHEAFAKLNGETLSAILIDERASSKGGQSILDSMKAVPSFKFVPVICTTLNADSAFAQAAKAVGHTVLVKPFARSVLLNTISGNVNKTIEADWDTIEPVQRSALKQTVSMFNSISDLIDAGTPLPYDKVKDSCAPLIQAVSNNCFKDVLSGVRGHDNYSYVHSLRVGTFLSLFGHTIGIRGDDLMTLSTGGLLHDVGKMTIPHDVLNKPGRLEGDEWTTMQSHVHRTVDFLDESNGIPKGVMAIASQHHEKLDGTGYPHGLKGAQLNELARMASIVDIFGALTDRRAYKDPMQPEKALNLMKGMSNELDQGLLALFREMLLDAASGLDTV